MVQFLVMQIRLGKITIEQVPLQYKLAVEEALNVQKVGEV